MYPGWPGTLFGTAICTFQVYCGVLDMQSVSAVLGSKPRVSCMLGSVHMLTLLICFVRVFGHFEGL